MSQSSILKNWQTCLLTVELVKPTLDLRRHAEDTSRLQGSKTWGSLVFEAGRLWVMAYCLAKISPMNKIETSFATTYTVFPFYDLSSPTLLRPLDRHEA